MKNYFQIPLFAIAVVIVLMVVGDAIAQSSQRGSSSRPSSYPGFTPKSSGSSTRSGSGARPYIPPSRGSSSQTRSRRSTRNPEESLVRKSEEPISAEARTALEELAAIQNELVTNRKQVDQMFREMPIGFAESQIQKQKEIDQAKAKAEVLKEQLIEKGIEVFRLVPLREATSTRIVMAKFKDSLSPETPNSHFDPKAAMEISKLLLDFDNLPVPVLMRAFKASYAVQDFEQASLILEKLEEIAPVKDVYYEVLEKTNQTWQDEQAIRRQEISTGDLPYAVVETTEGKFIIELFENEATLTVYDFVTRAESGFYDGLPFHLVRPGEFARVGWSRTTRGPANDTISSEAQKEKRRNHFAGSVSMVSYDGQTTSSVFQICHQPHLPNNGVHTVFGRVAPFEETIEGEKVSEDPMDVVYRLKTFDANRFTSDLIGASRIIKITIKNKRSHDYQSDVATATTAPPSTPTDPTIQAGPRVDETSSFDLLPQGGTQN